MKIQRVLAATTLTLLASAIAIAKPSGPAKLGVTPESSANCPVPTLTQCQNPEYLENDRCGKLQRVNQWTCTTLLKSKMEEEKTKRGEVTDTIPRDFTEEREGVGPVIKDGTVHGKDQYTPDLYSYTSKAAAADYGGPLALASANQYDLWKANGSFVDSCEEYAFEKFYDVSEYTRAVAHDRVDHLAAVKIAYGSGGKASSIGTRHLADPTLRGFDKRPFGAMLQGERKKNQFWNIPTNPPVPGKAGEVIPAAPNLHMSLSKVGGSTLVAKGTKAGGTVPNTWQSHLDYASKVLYIPPPNPPQNFQVAPHEDAQSKINTTFGSTGGPNPYRKRVARELDELFDLQERFRGLINEWARLNQRYAGSGWSYVLLDGAGGDGVTFPPGHIPVTPLDLSNGNSSSGGFGLKAAPKKPSGLQPTATVDKIDSGGDGVETAQRRRVLEEMVEVMEKADEEGCFASGVTGCDWSPKLFQRAVRNTFADAQDAAYESCNALTKGSVANAKNLDLVYVDDPDPAYAQFKCAIKTGDKLTASQLEELPVKHADCTTKKAAYEKQKAHDEKIAAAKARVLAKADLVDDPGNKTSEAKFKWPHLAKSRDEKMGGDKFNMGYNYDFGFDMHADNAACEFVLESHGSFNTYATVFGVEFKIIEAEAKFSSKEAEAHVFAKFAGKNLFSPPAEKKWEVDDQKWEWNVSKKPASVGRDYSLFKQWMVIVVIPVKIEAGLSGNAGINTGLELEAQGFNNKECPSVRLSGFAEPYAEIGGYVEAGIDIVVASVGIRGDLTIVKAGLPFSAGIGMKLANKDLSPLDPKRIEFFTDTRMDLELTTLSGGISVYGQVGWCPFCLRGEKEIVKFEGPTYNTNIFKKSYSVNMEDMAIAMGLIK